MGNPSLALSLVGIIANFTGVIELKQRARHPRKPRASTGRGREGKWKREKRGKRRGRGRGRKRAKGSPGNLLYTEHFSIEEQIPLARCETEALV